MVFGGKITSITPLYRPCTTYQVLTKNLFSLNTTQKNFCILYLYFNFYR